MSLQWVPRIGQGSQNGGSSLRLGCDQHTGVPTDNLFFDRNLLDGNANGTLDVSKSDYRGRPSNAPQHRIAAPLVCTDDALTAYNRVERC